MARVALLSGACIIGAYLLGSIPFGFLWSRGQLRRDLRRMNTVRGSLELQLRLLLAGVAGDPDRPSRADQAGGATNVLAAILDTAKVLAAATIAWHLVERFSPGHGHVRHFSLGAVAFTSNQVLLGHQSAGLWAGLSAAAAHLAPPWLGFRGGQGQAPVLALVLAYCPFGFSVGVLAFFVALLMTRDVPRSALLSLPPFVGFVWLAWAFDWRHSWGVPNGPELTLWAAALATIVAVRMWPPRPAAPPPG
jgi:glycerol-3-phosphate acyltransferase PlsY